LNQKLQQEFEEAERRRLFVAKPYPEGLMEAPEFVVDYSRSKKPVEPQPFPLRVAYRPPDDLSHLNPKPKPFVARPL